MPLITRDISCWAPGLSISKDLSWNAKLLIERIKTRIKILRMFSSNSTFTRCQLDQYFDHIELPAKYRAPTSRLDVNYLAALHIHHISTIPYENLALHYSPTRTISLKPEDLFNKFVTKECNRGGYCLENSLFFTYILRSLGFDAYPTGARIRLREDGVPKGDYIGL